MKEEPRPVRQAFSYSARATPTVWDGCVCLLSIFLHLCLLSIYLLFKVNALLQTVDTVNMLFYFFSRYWYLLKSTLFLFAFFVATSAKIKSFSVWDLSIYLSKSLSQCPVQSHISRRISHGVNTMIHSLSLSSFVIIPHFFFPWIYPKFLLLKKQKQKEKEKYHRHRFEVYST